VRLDVAVEVHHHEARELKETWIDLPPASLERPWHVGDDVALKPGGALALGQSIEGGGVDARVDGTACRRATSISMTTSIP
jgi:hypothetical protein